LLREMSVAAVARRMGMSWDQVDAIMLRAVERGHRRQQARLVRHIGIDKKAVKKRHRYFTIVSDLDAGVVLWIGRGRKRESIDAIEGIAMDMWQPYFESTMGARSWSGDQDCLRSVSFAATSCGFVRSSV